MLPLRDFIPTRRFPVLTVSIIVVNIIAFGYELLAEAGGTLDQTFYTMGVVPFEVTVRTGKRRQSSIWERCPIWAGSRGKTSSPPRNPMRKSNRLTKLKSPVLSPLVQHRELAGKGERYATTA